MCIRDSHLVALAELVNIPLSEVYEVSTFYEHFNIVKDPNLSSPEATIRVCESLTCGMFGSKELLNKLLSNKNKAIRVLRGPCMGRCHNAPTVCVGKNYVDNANVDKVLKLVDRKEYDPVIPNYINFDNYKQLGIKKLKERAKLVRENKEFIKKVAVILDDDAREKQELDSQMDVYPEDSIYKKFALPEDSKIMPEFHKVDWKDKFSILQKFKDERMQYFGKKILYEESPQSLPKEEYNICLLYTSDAADE